MHTGQASQWLSWRCHVADPPTLGHLPPCVQVSLGGPNGTDLIVHPPEQKEPLPLTIHHLPVAVTFALFEVGEGQLTKRVHQGKAQGFQPVRGVLSQRAS